MFKYTRLKKSHFYSKYGQNILSAYIVFKLDPIPAILGDTCH